MARKKLQKALALLMAFSMTMSLMSVSAFAEETGETPEEQPVVLESIGEVNPISVAYGTELDEVLAQLPVVVTGTVKAEEETIIPADAVLEEMPAEDPMAPVEGETGTPAEGEEKTEPPVEGEEKTETPVEGEGETGTPAEGEEETGTPAEGEEETEAPAEGGEETGTPAEGETLESETLTFAEAAPGEEVEVAVTWSCADYDGWTAGAYTFTATLAEGYELAEGVEDPTVTVTVKEQTGVVAKIGENEYATLDAAAAAAVDGDTITVLANCSIHDLTIQGMDLTIQSAEGAAHTIKFDTYGIHATDSKLTFKDCVLDMCVSDHIDHNGATANLIDDSDLVLSNVQMVLENDKADAAGDSGIYLYQGSNLYITDGSDVEIFGFNDSTRDSGIYADNSEYEGMPNREIIIDKASSLYVHDCGWHGMTINPINVTVDGNSSVELTKNGNDGYGGGLGCYYGKVTITDHSSLNADNNIGASWGAFVRELEVDGTSQLSTCGNKGVGLTVGGEAHIYKDAVFTSMNNAAYGLRIYQHQEDSDTGEVLWHGDCTIHEGANVTITHNARGIYNACELEMYAGEVRQNGVKSRYTTGGGIYNNGTAVIGEAVALYDNHASKAGDDIYNLDGASITFGETGSDWKLDGEPNHCTDDIDGWYEDGEGQRWEAHEKPYHVELVLGGGTISGAVALKAAHGLIPVEPDDPSITDWELSKSKTATNLDKNFESDVTLSLPAADYKPEIEVEFVIDATAGERWNAYKEQILGVVDYLQSLENVSAKVGVMGFANKTYNGIPMQELTDDSHAVFDKALGKAVYFFNRWIAPWAVKSGSSGTNIQYGIRAGMEVLEASESDAEQYLVLLTDGGAFYWLDDEGNSVTKPYASEGGKFFDSTAQEDMHTFNGSLNDLYSIASGTFADFRKDYGAQLETFAQTAKVCTKGTKGTAEDAYSVNVWHNKELYPFTNMEQGTYMAAKELAEVAASGVKVMTVGAYDYYPEQAAAHELSNMFLDWTDEVGNLYKINTGNDDETLAEAFKAIKNDLIQVVDAGSKVVDVIGYGKDNYGNDYDFDFVDDAENLVLTVDGEKLPVTDLTDPDLGFNDRNETARYGFGDSDPSYPGGYPFVLHYYAKGQDGKSDECFVWDINVSVSKFEPVQLTYTVVLNNPQGPADKNMTYGKYDEDGSEKLDSLWTNKEAILYPVDSKGDPGTPEYFDKPTVDYTVPKKPNEGGGGGGGDDGDDDPKPPVVIPDDPTPTDPGTVIPDDPTPADPGTDIPEENPPKADAPKTGDLSLLWLALTGLSGSGLAALSIRRKRDEE